MTTTIPDALALDLQALFLAQQTAAGLAVATDSVRLKHAITDTPSPRLVILVGEPRRQAGMDGTAFVPVSVQYISSMDRVTPSDHQTTAGKIDAWWRSIRASKRRNMLSSRVYLHELLTQQPTQSIREEEREQVTTIRGDLMVTLVSA